jgi:hypothetical protein
MANRLMRKLTDVTSAEDMLQIKDALEARQVPVRYQVYSGPEDADHFRLFVPMQYLEMARSLLFERYLRIHTEISASTIEILEEALTALRNGRGEQQS